MDHQIFQEFKSLQENQPPEGISEEVLILHQLTETPKLGDINVDQAWNAFEDQINTAQLVPNRSNHWLKVAAAALLVGVISLFYFTKQGVTDVGGQVIEISATEGKLYHRLPDNSEVWLRPGATISYNENFSGNRAVSLTGEAYFDITKGKGSFEVITKNLLVEVLGTEFVVNTNPQSGAEVIVSEGVVAVSSDAKKIEIKEGHFARYDMESRDLSHGRHTDQNALGWKTGKFSFDDTQLQEVIEYLNGYYENQIELRGEITNCKVTGYFDQLDLDQVIEELSIILSLHVKISTNTYVLSGEGC